ncbi:MAG: hypothetical protein ACKVX7_02205 [Planctomycetota bacterium]
MAECLNRYARLNEIVPVQSWIQDGVDGWLFRDRDNRFVFVATLKLLELKNGE